MQSNLNNNTTVVTLWQYHLTYLFANALVFYPICGKNVVVVSELKHVRF